MTIELYRKNDVTIHFEERQKLLVCYQGDEFCRVLPYHKPVKTIFQLKDDARAWYEEWICGKPLPSIRMIK